MIYHAVMIACLDLRTFLRGYEGGLWRFTISRAMLNISFCPFQFLLVTKELVLTLVFRFIYDDWFMPHTAAKLKFPYWDKQCLQSPQKDEL